jgi:hypothetical protein
MSDAVCDLHSGIEKDLKHHGEAIDKNHVTITRAHARIDGVAQSKVSNKLFYTVVIFIASAMISSIGLQYRTLASIDKQVAVISTKLEGIGE